MFFNLGGDKFCLDFFDDVEEAPLEALEALEARECREALLLFSEKDMLLFFLLSCYLLES